MCMPILKLGKSPKAAAYRVFLGSLVLRLVPTEVITATRGRELTVAEHPVSRVMAAIIVAG